MLLHTHFGITKDKSNVQNIQILLSYLILNAILENVKDNI